MSETDYEALKRILKPVLETARLVRDKQDVEGLLSYLFPDPRSVESRDGVLHETKLSFGCGPSGRLNMVVIQHHEGTAAYQRPEDRDPS